MTTRGCQFMLDRGYVLNVETDEWVKCFGGIPVIVTSPAAHSKRKLLMRALEVEEDYAKTCNKRFHAMFAGWGEAVTAFRNKRFQHLLDDGERWPEVFEHVFFFVEATDTERHLLRQNHQKIHVDAVKRGTRRGEFNGWCGPALRWGNAPFGGRMITAGYLAGNSINVALYFELIEDQIVCFYTAVSNVVDHATIEQWFKDQGCDWTVHRKPFQNHSNAMNFGHCVQHLLKLGGR